MPIQTLTQKTDCMPPIRVYCNMLFTALSSNIIKPNYKHCNFRDDRPRGHDAPKDRVSKKLVKL